MKSSLKNNFKKIGSKQTRKDSRIPGSIISIGVKHFKKEIGLRMHPLSSYRKELNQTLSTLTLNEKNIRVREYNREQIECPFVMRISYDVVCFMLDVIYKDKPIDRFWFLENIARMPYVSYVAVLHLYETLGWWYVDSDIKRHHVEQEANETHHLAIMESLYGDRFWWNRFLTRHLAIGYYMFLVVLFMSSPKLAYLSSELLEMHAFDTYFEFTEENKKELEQLMPTFAAEQYMSNATSMFDVFVQITNDEKEHASMLKTTQKLKTKGHE
jgi:ubiquinol oxidase